MARTTDRPSPRQPSDIKVLYRFHQNNRCSKCEVAHISPPDSVLTIRPSDLGLLPEGEQMAPKRDNLIRLVVVLALLAVTAVAIMTWASQYKQASAGPSSGVIYRAQHLNLY